jgi:DNA-binding LacI/PurR family transcriptional regulator
MASGIPERAVGLVATWLHTDYWTRLVAGATDVLRREGWVPICFTLGHPQGVEPRMPPEFYDLVSPDCLSGMIVAACAAFQNDAEDFLRRHGDLPAVCFGRWVRDVPSVWVQNAVGVRLLMQHLTQDCGRRRIAFIRGSSPHPEADARFRAWEDFCIERTLEHGPNLVEQGEFTAPSGEAATLRLLEKNAQPRFDAIVASNDLMAIGALRALKSRGLSVPEEISVAGFDDLEAGRADPPLTTVRQPVYEMGCRAAEVLLAQAVGAQPSSEHMFSPQLVVRASSRPEQPRAMAQSHTSSFGPTVFLQPAYPSPESAMAVPGDGQIDRSVRGSEMLAKFGDSLALTRAHQAGLAAALKRTRTYAVRHLDRALRDARSLEQLRTALEKLLPLLGVDSLTAATVTDEARFRGNARLVVDCQVDDREAMGGAGPVLPCSQIIALHAERPATLHVVEPLFDGDHAFGFFMASGALFDEETLYELGAVLARTLLRIGQ